MDFFSFFKKKEYYPTGELQYIGPSKKGSWHGERKKYNKDGILVEKQNFKDGVCDGLCVQYHENGRVSRRMFYKNGVPDGLEETFDELGKLKEKFIHKQDGDGSREGYHEDGRLAYTAFYQNGKCISEISFYTDGRLKTKSGYVDGLWVKEFYDRDGCVEEKRIGNSAEGSLDTEQTFYKNGLLKEEKIYHHDCQWYVSRRNAKDGTPIPREKIRTTIREIDEEYDYINEDWNRKVKAYEVDGYGRQCGQERNYYNGERVDKSSDKNALLLKKSRDKER